MDSNEELFLKVRDRYRDQLLGHFEEIFSDYLMDLQEDLVRVFAEDLRSELGDRVVEMVAARELAPIFVGVSKKLSLLLVDEVVVEVIESVENESELEIVEFEVEDFPTFLASFLNDQMNWIVSDLVGSVTAVAANELEMSMLYQIAGAHAADGRTFDEAVALMGLDSVVADRISFLFEEV
jgi:hypothetical protein